MAVTSAARPRESGDGDSPFDLQAAPKSGPQRRGSEVLVGLLMVVLFSLAAVWFYITSTASTAYVFLANDVEQGQPISRDDLAVFEVSTEADLRAVTAAEALSVIDRVARTDLAAGSLLSPDQLVGEAEIPDGFGVVGLDLSPGAYPRPSLRPGDQVIVVAVAGPGLSDGDAETLTEAVEVVEVTPTSSGLLVSLLVPSGDTNRVMLADAQGLARLIQVPKG